MARSYTADYFHSMRFHVSAQTAAGTNPLKYGTVEAGFTNVTTPDITVAPVEYREGHYLYTRKYPGIPSMGEMQMSRGVARKDTSFWLWLKSAIHGSDEYRATLTIQHFHKADYTTLSVSDGTISALTDPSKTVASRKYVVYEAIPTHHKVAADLDANAGEVSIMNMDVAYEYFNIVDAG